MNKERLLAWLQRNKYMGLLIALFWGLGLYMGWGSGAPPAAKKGPTSQASGHTHTKKKTIWTCSMHPQIRLPKKTKCPICFMDLIPVQEGAGGQDPRTLQLSEVGKLLAEIRTSRVERRPVFLDVSMPGRVAYDETRIKTITAWVAGRLERLFVDYTGVPVRRGDHLVRIYSPELLAAQQEYLQAHKAMQQAKRSGSRGLVYQTSKMAMDSVEQKLVLLGLRKWQLRKLLRNGKPSIRINTYAPMGGIVIQKKAMEGMYVKTGTHIYTIADLSQVWIKFEAYERDLTWLHVGQGVSFETLAYPGEAFSGKIVYIDPMLDPTTRTVSVRVNASNKDGRLKPEMFVSGRVHVSVNALGHSHPPDRSGSWSCPMHPEVVRKSRTNCPVCGMRLERIRANSRDQKAAKGHQDPLVIPSSAPLLTGKRAVVYIEVPNKKQPTYQGRDVTLGPRAGDYYVVLDGLKEGERVITQGAFKLDSELQLKARISMMAPGDTPPSKPPAKRKARPKVSSLFLQELQPFYDAYFALSSGLSSDQPKAAKAAYERLWGLLRKRLSAKGRERTTWARHRSLLYDAVKQGRQFNTIELQRKTFEQVSQQMIALEREIGHAGMGSYHLAHCPMAFDNRGAHWLQRSKKELRNPYFGSKMLHCGSFQKAFVGRAGEAIVASKAFVRRLQPVYDTYLALQDALFRDKLADAQGATSKLKKTLSTKRRHLLQSSHRAQWATLRKRLQKHVDVAAKTKDIEALRVAFEDLSKDVLQLLFIFGHSGKQAVYEAFCPMAFNNRGAAWVQSQDQTVHNAYFGAKMAHCGSIRRKFSPRFK